ncbi:MAG: PQQ-binding-like beta-propeller repeat protein [Clostridiales bacterium]|nr:PQQ-binding-like beta-propeller repeat protein [Clostridiales bacterium]
MMKKSENVRYENQYYRPRRVNNNGLYILFMVTVVLVATTLILAIVTLVKSKKKTKAPETTTTSEAIVTNENGEVISSAGIVVMTPEPTQPPTIESYQNPILYPAKAQMNVEIGTPDAKYSPSGRGATQVVYDDTEKISGYQRTDEIHFGDPLYYQQVGGILTFRGTNFRNCASWGTFSLDPSKQDHLEQVWEYNGLEWKKSSSWSFSWSGTGWTGQPLAVKWPLETRQLMNMYPEKKNKQDLTEVIIAAMDGYVYFFDLEDGQKTRDPLKVGATIKGTPAVDPRGYPILYVGQGDDNGEKGQIGFRIYSLLDFKLLHMQNGLDSRAYRSTWGACDSSPIICAEADTLIYPNENGMIYTVKLNTDFNPGTGTLTINPRTVAYKYIFDGVEGSQLGIESSMAVYDHYGWCTDNAGNLICIDLNTMELIWSRRLDDDSDVTPVIEEDNGHVYLYTGTEVDWQKDIVGNYQGASFTYKFDAMTGDYVWQTSVDCWTKNAANSGDDVNGGMLGTPVIGKGSISNLVIFSYCMTEGTGSGNRLVAFDKNTGDTVWKYDMKFYSWSSPVDIYDENGNAYIVVCDSLGQVHMVDAATGTRLCYIKMHRTQDIPENEYHNVESSPIVVDGMLVVGTRGNSIFGVKIS